MFELLFKYPSIMFHKGEFVFGRGWPVWLLVALCTAAAAYVAVVAFRARGRTAEPPPQVSVHRWLRPLVLGALSWATLAVLLLMLCSPP